jgi:hypothetical protein
VWSLELGAKRCKAESKNDVGVWVSRIDGGICGPGPVLVIFGGLEE